VLETPDVHSTQLATPLGGRQTLSALGKRKLELVEDELSSEITMSTASKTRRLSSAVKQLPSPANVEEDELGEEDSEIQLLGQRSVAASSRSVRNNRATRSVSASELPDTPSIVSRKTHQTKRKDAASPRAFQEITNEETAALDTTETDIEYDNTQSNLFVSEGPVSLEGNDTTIGNDPLPMNDNDTTMSDDLSLRNDEDDARRRMPPPPKPVSKRKPSNVQPKRKRYGGPMLEITVYRRTKDPTNTLDIKNGNTLPSVNAADILSQVVAELGNSNLEALKAKQSRGSSQFQRAVRRRQATIKTFMARVDDCLFDMSNAQNAVYAVSSKLQRIKREQGNLRAELMKLKKERDEVNFNIDSVREKHAQRAKENDEQNGLLRQLHDLDIAIQRGRLKAAEQAAESDDEDNEPVLNGNQLLADVARFVGDGGFMKSVQMWNEFLEKSSDVLQNAAAT
jgi:hypothetical protein